MNDFFPSLYLTKGASIKYVTLRGGRGFLKSVTSSVLNIGNTLTKGGGEGVENSHFKRDVLNGCPRRNLLEKLIGETS